MTTDTSPVEPAFDVHSLYAPFNLISEPPEFEIVSADSVPQPYQQLLVHEHHMTVTVEEFHGGPVILRVLGLNHVKSDYTRLILLAHQETEKVVQMGIMRINFDFCDKPVREEILARNKPLGRILIEHDVLRRIELLRLLKVTPNKPMVSWFEIEEPTTTYGRLAVIHCDNKPAVELLEVLAPVKIASQ